MRRRRLQLPLNTRDVERFQPVLDFDNSALDFAGINGRCITPHLVCIFWYKVAMKRKRCTKLCATESNQVIKINHECWPYFAQLQRNTTKICPACAAVSCFYHFLPPDWLINPCG